MAKVVLDSGEMATAQLHAEMRNGANRSSGVGDQRRDNSRPAIMLDLHGMQAELAWSKATGTYPDLSIQPRSGTADAVFRGKRVDIKSTPYKTGKLLATTGKSVGDADVYVLAIVQENVVNFVGWASASELLREETITTSLGHGPTHALPQAKLHPFSPGFFEGTPA